jgi:UDP-N-acetylmuramate: L-alanyl-gamma-D-glutamyl-meso-diaminopimelate ligase
MGGVAALAREAGFDVSGSDTNVYPPMSDQLEAQGIELMEGYDPSHLEPAPDCVVIGNALSRGNPAVEHVLNEGINYASGPQWLADNVLRGRRVVAVAGTHGKTTTSSMLAWILEAAGRQPGFLIGGIPRNFDISARHGAGQPFVVEADEYDTAFFDKRSKFVHYRPQVAVLNNLEFDHADIFPDLAAIQRQFHHFIRTVPGQGLIVSNGEDTVLSETLAMGCWTSVERFALDPESDSAWQARGVHHGGRRFQLVHNNRDVAPVEMDIAGRHNVKNALAAIAASTAFGVEPQQAASAMRGFHGVKRRLEPYGPFGGITVYDDFAHHPTEIRECLAALRGIAGQARILVALEPRSNTMRAGIHADELAPALAEADHVWLWSEPGWTWDPSRVTGALAERGETATSVSGMVDSVLDHARPGDHVVFMSNGGFGGARARLVEALNANA